ncbi:MAG: thioesterase family protein [Anaerolineae bacterium]|nr:MAG: thioesterase family protein [Anaerolineae bacterium]
MPLTHERTFRVRHYECDAYGYVHYVHYLNYMQEAAFDASAAAGYGVPRYAAMGCYWLVRETEVEVLRPLRYGDVVQVKTWVDDFRRVRSRRAYELRQVGSGALAARACTDWVFMDVAAGRPAPIPAEMLAAFFPEGLPEPGPPRPRFPAAPEPPPGVFRLRRQVEWRDVDTAGHVNNAAHLAYLEDCGVQAAAARGWPAARMQAEGFTVVARQHRIEYLQPALPGDEIELATWASDVDRSTAVRHYTARRVGDGALLVRARTLWACVDVETGQSLPIPDPFLTDLAPNISKG